MPGPGPKPTAIKILEGNPGKRPLPDREPHPPLGVPKCPKWLRKDARKFWRPLMSKLEVMGIATEVDDWSAAHLCEAMADWRRLADGENWPAKDAAWRRVYLMMPRFGLDPSSRARVKVEKQAQPKDDPWLGLLN